MEYRSLRTHAKLVLLAFADGRKMTVESSANLRSCKNIEQATLIGDPGLYAFHRGWIDGLFERHGHEHPAAPLTCPTWPASNSPKSPATARR